ncbi:MAG: quinolinate synthase NadA, partial [Bilophila sp.]
MTPLEVSQQTAEALSCAIDASRAALGTRVTLVGHHYQHQNVVNHCDFLGDSLELARRVAGIESEHIVFCGVYFMA